MTRIDELVSLILPTEDLPEHLRPAHLLDRDLEPPEHIAKEVHALRALVRTSGRGEPFTWAIVSSRDVAKVYAPRLSADRVESVWVVGLDARGRARVEREIARGGPSHCPVSPGDILRVLVLNGCPTGILLHNHPSGDPTPSLEDLQLTNRVVAGAEILGLTLLDHVIVGVGRWYSFLDEGLLGAPLRKSA